MDFIFISILSLHLLVHHQAVTQQSDNLTLGDTLLHARKSML